MKQARYWLLMAALLLLPQAAHAQKKPAKPAPAPAAAQTDDIELDEPKPVDLDSPGDAPTETPTDTPPSDGGEAGGGICEIDPSACPKASDMKALSTKDLKEEIYAVQQIYALRRGRFELMPYWSFSLNDQFVSHPGPGLGVNYYITNVLALGVNGTFHQPFNGDSDFNFQNRRATRIAVPLNEYQAVGTFNFTYVPMYGKFAGFNKFIFHYDSYLVGGVGAISTRPIAVIDPDNRSFDYEWRLAFSVGIGLRVFLNRWFAVTAELRDYIYVEQLESTTVAQTQEGQRDRATWFGENPLTNNFQAQIGISMFLPFSWQYKLPK